MHHNFRTDDVVDVQDFFNSRIDGRVMCKWRKCQILNVRPYYIRVTFVGWSAQFDTSIHVLEEADRIAEFGKYTERQQVCEGLFVILIPTFGMRWEGFCSGGVFSSSSFSSQST
jgi:hypothetical protein